MQFLVGRIKVLRIKLNVDCALFLDLSLTFFSLRAPSNSWVKTELLGIFPLADASTFRRLSLARLGLKEKEISRRSLGILHTRPLEEGAVLFLYLSSHNVTSGWPRACKKLFICSVSRLETIWQNIYTLCSWYIGLGVPECVLSCFSRVWLCSPADCSPPGSCLWDSPGKNTGVSCHTLLQGSSLPRDQTCVSHVSCMDRRVLYH